MLVSFKTTGICAGMPMLVANCEHAPYSNLKFFLRVVYH